MNNALSNYTKLIFQHLKCFFPVVRFNNSTRHPIPHGKAIGIKKNGRMARVTECVVSLTSALSLHRRRSISIHAHP
jgi:hypothetical protein